MKRLLPLLLLAAGCTASSRSFEGTPEPPEMPPVPPERVLREPVDFQFTDFGTQKRYLMRFYQDERVSDIVVTVFEEGKRERQATDAERDYALTVLIADWRSKNTDEKLAYHRELLENEIRRDETLLDYKIQGKEYAVRQLEETRDSILFNLRARKDTGFTPKNAKTLHPDHKEGERCTCPSNEASNEELERQLAYHELNLRLARAELEILRYRRALRDGEYARSTASYHRRDAILVSDIVPLYTTAERLIDQIKANVDPESWKKSLCRIEFKDGYLLVTQHPKVIANVRAYLERERGSFKSRPRQK